MTDRHPYTEGWAFPRADRPALDAGLERTNLRALCARPGRFEHHLLVVARIGDVQLELPTASEPLAFGHVNLSDEYVLVLPSGHAMLDAFPYRVFVSDAQTGEDLLRVNHRVLDLVLHPYGFSHWPARLRAPYAMPPIPPGMRRAGLTLVLCASKITGPAADRELWVTPGLDEAVKRMGAGDVPVLLADLKRERARTVARVGDVVWELAVDPEAIRLPRGGYVTVLEAAHDSAHFATDLVFVPSGGELDARGITRALVMRSDAHDAAPPPPSWRALPEPAFAPFEARERLALPQRLGALQVDSLDAQHVRVTLEGAVRDVPRYWLARLLFRWALHNYRLGYAETYAGFFVDDTAGIPRLGLASVGHVTASSAEIAAFVEHLYRACAPEGYVEDLR